MVYQIPLISAHDQIAHITLSVKGENVPTQIRLRWNWTCEYWYMSIYDVRQKKLVLDAIPLESMYRDLQSTTITVGVKKPYKTDHTDEYGMWLSYDQIMTLTGGLYNKCLVCSLDPIEERKCKIRKVLDAIGYDIEHPDGECGYRDRILDFGGNDNERQNRK